MGQHKKVLFVTSADLSQKHSTGGEQVCLRNLNILKNMFGANNTFTLFFSDNCTDISKGVFKRIRKANLLIAELFGSRMYFPWTRAKILEYIFKLEPDIIFFDGIQAGELLSHIDSNAKIFVFEHNCEHDFFFNKVKNEGLVYLLDYLAVSRAEKISINKADVLVCLNSRDSQRLHSLYNRSADIIMPISFDDRLEKSKVNLINEKVLLFIGSNFGPNRDGIKWFVENVMAELPEFKLLIVGKDFEKEKDELSRENVTVIGTVDSLDEYYYTYGVLVMPIFYGSGMKVKTAEAMMFGKNIIGTKEAFEGYDLNNIEGVYCCDTKESFIEAINDVFLHNRQCIFNDMVYQIFITQYTTDGIQTKFTHYIRNTLYT